MNISHGITVAFMSPAEGRQTLTRSVGRLRKGGEKAQKSFNSFAAVRKSIRVRWHFKCRFCFPPLIDGQVEMDGSRNATAFSNQRLKWMDKIWSWKKIRTDKE